MVALTSLLLSAVLATSAAAAPVVHAEGILKLPTLPLGLLCNVPGRIAKLLCPAATTTKASIVTKLGMAIGVDSGDAYRFTVRYGVAQRWQPATLVTGWSLPYVRGTIFECRTASAHTRDQPTGTIAPIHPHSRSRARSRVSTQASTRRIVCP